RERFDHLAEEDAEGDGDGGGSPGVIGRGPAARDAPGGEREDRDGEEPVGVPPEAAAVVFVAGEVPVEVDGEAEEEGEGEGETRTHGMSLRGWIVHPKMVGSGHRARSPRRARLKPRPGSAAKSGTTRPF